MMYATQRPVKLSRIPGILAASLHLKDVFFVSYSNLKIQLFLAPSRLNLVGQCLRATLNSLVPPFTGTYILTECHYNVNESKPQRTCRWQCYITFCQSVEPR